MEYMLGAVMIVGDSLHGDESNLHLGFLLPCPNYDRPKRRMVRPL
jgi:hypothetical protein